MTMVRTGEWKLVHFIDDPGGQLFDLRADPGEVENLWEDAGHVAVKRGLLDELRDWRIRSGCHTREWGATWR